MNYYPHHLGDYAKDTGTLSMLEHGAYRLLLDAYYSTELPIPEDEVYRAAKAVTKADRAAVDYVLKKFFVLSNGAYSQSRAEREISILNDARGRAQSNGQKGGRPPKQKPSGNPEETQRVICGLPNQNPAETQGETTRARPHEPNNQEPNESHSRHARPLPNGAVYADSPDPAGEHLPEEPPPLPPPVSRELCIANSATFGTPPEVASLWWDDRDSFGWRCPKGRKIHSWQSNMRAFAARFDSNERQRADQIERTRKEITARIERREAKTTGRQSAIPDKWGRVEPNAADAKKLRADLAKAQQRQKDDDEKLKAGARMTPEDIAAMKAEILTQTPP